MLAVVFVSYLLMLAAIATSNTLGGIKIYFQL